MKEFWIYTGLRIAMFVGSFAIVFGVWFLAADSVPLLLVLVLSFVVSGVASYFLLQRQRDAFAVKVEGRASRAAQKFEERRAKEDVD